MKVTLGKTYKDKVTGFKGVATGRCEYLSGCNQALLIPKVGEDGAYKEGQWLDEQRLLIQEEMQVTLDNGINPGPDKAAPKY